MNSRFSKSRFPLQDNTVYIITFLIFLLSAYLITLGGLLIMALLLYKVPLADSAVNIGIVILYILSTFLASFICGKKLKKKKYLWGFLIGTAYFLILLLISFVTDKSTGGLGSNIFTTYIVCSGAGTLGGMLA